MTRHSTGKYLFLVVFLLLALGLLYLLRKNGNLIFGPSGEPLPIHVLEVSPADGATRKDTEEVCAYFDFRVGNGLGSEPWDLITFYLDDKDISSQGGWGYVQISPPITGTFCHPLSPSLSPGWHQVKLIYQDLKGNRFKYIWNFRVASN